MEIKNTLDQEMQTRHALLFSEILGVLNRRADPFGHAWVEVINDGMLQAHSRYVEDGQTYEITQTVRVMYRAVQIHRTPSS